jgi:hypothetical protein
MTNANDCAFPSSQQWHTDGGLTKREYFAAMAMQGLLAQLATSNIKVAKMQREYWMKAYGGDITEAEAISREAVLVADNMILQLSKPIKAPNPEVSDTTEATSKDESR